MQDLWKEFKEFALGGNLVQLAVAFVLGVAFAAVVTSVVEDLFMPIIGAIVSDQSFANLTLELGGAEVRYGNFISVLINFLAVALVLFIIVKAYNELKRKEEAGPETIKACPYCKTDIAIEATRCPACTSQLEAVA